MEVLYIFLLGAQFPCYFVYIFANGGIGKHTYFTFCLILYFAYLWLSAFNTWTSQQLYHGSFDFSDIFEEGVFYYALALFCFGLGYMLGATKKPTSFYKTERVFNDKMLIRMTILFLFINYGLRFVGGSGLSGSAETYVYLTQDFLIILTIGIYSRNLNSWFFVFTLASSIFLFASNFFRYRIILTLLGVALIYLKRNPDIIKKIGKYLLIGVVATYAILFFTINRKPLADNDFDKIKFNFFEKEDNLDETVSGEGSNLMSDFMVLKLYRDDVSYPHDWGETMFIFPIIRALPGNLFPDGKPYPPSLTTIINAFGGTDEAKHAGRAVTNTVEFFIAFGWPGMIFFMFLFGRILKSLQNKWIMDGSFNEMLQIAILVSLFQYITRGYFPQYLTHISYLVAPIYILRKLSPIKVDPNYVPKKRLNL
jgi:hypothetical protein